MALPLALLRGRGALFALLLTLGASLHLKAEDWPHWRGPNRDGISPERDWFKPWPQEGPKQLWKANIGIGFSSISVADGRAYASGNQENIDTIYCLDAKTGKVIWKHSYPSPLDPNLYEGGPSATPTVHEGRVYTFSKDGALLCLNAEDGKVQWQSHLVKEHGVKKPEWGFASSPFILGDSLYLNAGGAGASFNEKSGKLLWLSSKEMGAYATPIVVPISEKPALVFLSQRELVAVRPDDGDLVWRQEWKTSYDTSSVDAVANGARFFVSSYRQPGTLFDATSGKPQKVWENKEFNVNMNAPVLIDGFLYGFHGDQRHDHEFKCLSFDSGKTIWTEKNLPVGSLIAAEGKLIILTGKGELVIADASSEKFTPLARAQILGGKCWTAPTLANGNLYARNAKGDLVCIAMK